MESHASFQTQGPVSAALLAATLAEESDLPNQPSGVSRFCRHIAAAVRANWGVGLLILGGLLIEMGFNSAVPLSFKYLVDSAIMPKDYHVLLTILVLLTVGVIVVSGTGLGRDYIYAKFSTKLLNDLRLRMFTHLQRLSMDYFARSQAADIMARFSTDLISVENALVPALPNCVLPMLDMCASVFLLFTLEWRLALVALLVLPVCMIGPRLITPRATAASYQRKQNESQTAFQVQENVAAVSVIKAFGIEKSVLGRFLERIGRLAASSLRVSFLGSLIERTAGIGTMVLQVVVIAVGAYMSFRDTLSIGSLVSFQAIFVNFCLSLNYIAQYYPLLVQAGAGMQRIDELLNEKPRVVDAPDAKTLPRLSQEIRFEGVKFGYFPPEVNLKGASFTVGAGESVAFVGPSGAGKSTVVSLFTRFYEPDEGRVLFDGCDLRLVAQDSLRAQIGIVFQVSILFNATVRENIRVGKNDATDAEIVAAAKAAEIHDGIIALTDGYDTLVGEHVGRLSDDQRQRIGIARAVLRNPDLLILDEATTALDAGSEDAMNETLKRLSQGRTVISTTHRLSAIAGMDRIFVLDAGRIAEQGTHEELLARGGLYAKLWQKQGGFQIADNGKRATVDTARLRAIPILQSLDEASLGALADTFITERFPADRDIVHVGDAGDKFYIIARGKTAVLAPDAQGELKQVGTLEDGDYFGEISLISDMPRTATVRTLTDCTLLSLRQERFLKLLEREPKLRQSLKQVAAEHLASIRKIQEPAMQQLAETAAAMPDGSRAAAAATRTTAAAP